MRFSTQKIRDIFILLIISTFLLACGGGRVEHKEPMELPIDSLTNKITYSQVVHVDSSANKEELYSRAREWFAKTYKSSINVIQMEDKENGQIIGKALFSSYWKNAIGDDLQDGHINYTISIDFKDGRYKYKITDFYHTGTYQTPNGGVLENLFKEKKGYSYRNLAESYLYQTDRKIKSLVSDLKQSMATNTKKEEW